MCISEKKSLLCLDILPGVSSSAIHFLSSVSVGIVVGGGGTDLTHKENNLLPFNNGIPDMFTYMNKVLFCSVLFCIKFMPMQTDIENEIVKGACILKLKFSQINNFALV